MVDDVYQDYAGIVAQALGDGIIVTNNKGHSWYTRRPKKTCLNLAQSWLRHTKGKIPTPEQWAKNKGMLTLRTVEKIFGSYDAMIEELIAPPAKKKRKQYADEDLAKALYRACRYWGKSYITSSQYVSWQNGRDDIDDLPSFNTIKRLGNGRWSEKMFVKAFDILEIEPVNFERDMPMPNPQIKPDDWRMLCSFRLINTLGRDCKINGTVLKAPVGHPFAVIEKIYRPGSGFMHGQHGIIRLKLASGDLEHLADFPEIKPGTFYVIDQAVYDVLPVEQRRSDLLPVNFKVSKKPSVLITDNLATFDDK